MAESESGQRMLKLAPQLLASKDMNNVMEVRDWSWSILSQYLYLIGQYHHNTYLWLFQVLGKEVEYNWRLFFTYLLNSGYKNEFILKISEASVKVLFIDNYVFTTDLVNIF